MKQIPEMTLRSLAYGIAASLLAFVSLVPVASANSDDAVVRASGGLSYVSGGVGTDSIDRLNSLAGDFNLKLGLP